MANHDEKNKYAYLDQLSTEELRQLLCADIDSPVNGDDEAIFYILEVIESREQAHPSSPFPDLGKSWKEFNELYNTPEAADISLYPIENDAAPVLNSICKKSIHKRPFLRRSLLVAAAIICLIAALTIPVAGYANLFQMVGQWSAEQFGFTPETPVESSSLMYPSPGPVITSGNGIRDILVQNGIKENVIPKWMPDGFKLLDEISVYEFGSSGNLQVDAAYSDGTDFLSYSVIRHKSQIYSTLYEKDEGNVEVYTTNGIEHYIFSNLSVYTAAWCIDDLECSISTSLPKSDLTKAIDSIYEE